MRNILLIFSFIVGLSYAGIAQTITISGGQSQIANGYNSDFEIIAHATIKNVSNQNLNLTWERTVNSITSGWQVTLCDPIACRAPTLTTASFSLAPGDSGAFDCHAYPAGATGSVDVTYKVYITGNTTPIMTKSYIINANVTRTSALMRSQLQIFPNPATDVLSIRLPENIKEYTLEIFNIIGKKIPVSINQSAESLLTVNVEDLPKGTYVVRVYNNKGLSFTRNFIKTN